MSNSEYPEHDKLQGVKKKSQSIGEFLEWLQTTREPHLHICELIEAGNNGEPRYIPIEPGEYVSSFFRGRMEDGTEGKENPDYESWGTHFRSTNTSIIDLLSEYFTIDQKKLEKEKKAMLNAIRAHNAKKAEA